MAPPIKRTYLRDLDGEERVDFAAAVGEASAIVKQGGDYTKLDNVPVPSALDLESPEAATNWAEQEILKATPRAVQEVIHQMRKGDSKARLTAALQILDRAGVKARENNVTVAPVIVLTQDAVANLPWVKKAAQLAGSAAKVGQIVDGQLINKVAADAKKDR